MIIALTGPIGSGKGEAALYLKEKGFQYLVYSDILREAAKEQGIEPTRENLNKIGISIKEQFHDPGYLSKRLLEKVSKKDAVVDGVRNVGEIKELKKMKDAHVIGVAAPQRLRFRRVFGRKRDGDPTTFSAFKKIDNLENRGKTKGQEINACLKHADFIIHNSGAVGDLKKKVDEAIALFTKRT